MFPVQMRTANANKIRVQQRARTGLVKLANRRLQPLGHLSGVLFYQFIIKLQIFTGHSRGKAFRFQVY